MKHRHAILILLALVLIGGLGADALGANWPDPRIVFLEDGGTASFVDVGGKTVLLSCAHRTTTTHVNVGDQLTARCNDGTRLQVKYIAVAPFDLDSPTVTDVAILSFSGNPPANTKPLKISTRPLQRGERVWIYGFPVPQQRYSCRMTTVLSDDGTLWLNGPSKPGESGGPVLNSFGELVGTLTATTTDGRTFCSARGPASELCKSIQTDWLQKPRCCPPQPAPLPPAPIPVPYTPEPEKVVGCECGPKWTEINIQVNALKLEISQRQEVINNLVSIVNELKERKPQSSTLNFIGADGKVVASAVVTPGETTDVTLPPINFRVQDQRGAGFSTEYQPARLGSYVTLPFGPAQ